MSGKRLLSRYGRMRPITFLLLFCLVGTAALAGEPMPSDRPTITPAEKQNVIVFQEAGRYGGWPANSGIWSWGNEIVVVFTAGWYMNKSGHAVDPGKPQEKWQARSVDGGLTWSIEKPECFVSGKIKPSMLSEPLDFTHPDFAMMFAFWNGNEGPSWIFVSTDRCRTWRGPLAFGVEGIQKVVTRTDYLVLGKHDCLMFGSGAKQNGRQGRAFCARTTDGGLTWRLVSLIGPEPAGYSIMPSTLRLAGDAILTTIRHAEPRRTAWIDAYRSDDAGRQWNCLGEVTSNIGNPPSLVRLNDGRICLTYGYRLEPYGARARITTDEGRSWGPEIVLREDGLTDDLGYARSVVRPDGKIVTIYYFNGPKHSDRTIEATIWTP